MSDESKKLDPASADEAGSPETPAESDAPKVPETGAPPADAPATEEAATDAPAPPEKSGSDAPAEPPRRKPRFPSLIRACRTGRPVEGTIQQVIKGGYEVKVGRARGFCPHSQVDVHREDHPEQQVGKTYMFRVTQVRRGGEDVVLSRRAVLEEDRADEAKAVRATLIEGTVMQGHVASVAPFGAFVDLGAGVLGLVHLSELAHRRINRAEDVVKLGDAVRVKVLKIDEAKGRISLSIRKAVADPWAGIRERFEVGQVYPGTIQRLADFGAFVELAPGVEALAPASEFPPAPDGWKAGLQVGAQRDWHVLSVDSKARRLSITLPVEGIEPRETLESGLELQGKVQRIERYGVFVWLGPGQVGLMPRPLCGSPEGADLQRRFKIGDDVEVSVVDITEGGRKIRLARKGVSVKPEPAPATRSKKKDDDRPAQLEEDTSTFGTSLGDKLRAALGRSEGS